MTNPITPPPELVDQWVAEACPECRLTYDEFTGESVEILVARAAQWGADRELEACCKWLPQMPPWSGKDLRKHRRPKPPSLKEQALEAQQRLMTGAWRAEDWQLISRALEALDD